MSHLSGQLPYLQTFTGSYLQPLYLYPQNTRFAHTGFRVSGLRGRRSRTHVPRMTITSIHDYPNFSRLPRFLAFLGAIPQGHGQIIRFGRIFTHNVDWCIVLLLYIYWLAEDLHPNRDLNSLTWSFRRFCNWFCSKHHSHLETILGLRRIARNLVPSLVTTIRQHCTCTTEQKNTGNLMMKTYETRRFAKLTVNVHQEDTWSMVLRNKLTWPCF